MDEEDVMKCRKRPNEWRCPIDNCDKHLSRKQTLKSHLSSVHGIEGKIENKCNHGN